MNFEYSTNATDLVTGTWTGVAALNFVTPDTATTGAKNGNAAADRTALSSTILSLSIPNGATFWIRWNDTDATGADDGLAVDDFSLTPQNVVQPNLTINDVSLNEGNAGTTSFTFTVSLSAPAGAGGVTFDIATADGTATQPSDYTQKTLTAQTIPAGSSTYSFTVLVNGDTTPETNETFFVNVTNVTNAIVTDGQGLGTIVNDDITFIHDVQGNGAATPIPGATVTVEGIVTADFQGTNIQGFFLQEEETDADADPNTSEGIFVFCGGCPTPVAEGQRVKATGTVSEFNNLTEITASTAPSVVVTNAGNNLALVTPSPISLPIAGNVDAYYEAREGMKVTFVDTLTVSEYFELGRYGHVHLKDQRGGKGVPKRQQELEAWAARPLNELVAEMNAKRQDARVGVRATQDEMKRLQDEIRDAKRPFDQRIAESKKDARTFIQQAKNGAKSIPDLEDQVAALSVPNLRRSLPALASR
jgi:predicted extracellular nuclease